MSDAQNSPAGINAEPRSLEPKPNHDSRLTGFANGEKWGEFRRQDIVNPGGHTLLSRPSSQQGRKSLFRC